MPKNIEDIVIAERRKSIRDVPMPEGRRKSDTKSTAARSATPSADVVRPTAPESVPPIPRKPVRRRRSAPSGKMWVLIGAVVLVLIFLVLSLFRGATLAYTPKSAPLNFEGETYSANKTGEDGLLFSVVKLSGEKEVSVPATGQEEASIKASGTIIVYNQESSAQRLIGTTRFQTSEGKVYRIEDAITVPAKGSVEAVVYADQPGESYNIGLSDFTLPGLAGTPRHTTVYARSKTPMSGGFVGMMPSVSDNVLASAKSNLQTELKNELATQASAQVPGDFILFPSLSTITYDDLPQSQGVDSSAVVKVRGNFYGVMFKRSDLAAFLASKKATLASGDVVDVPALESLQLAFDGTPPTDLLNSNQINFTINGSATLLWRTNEESLKSELIGRHKSEVSSILLNYPSIAEAEAMVRPFWKKSFPGEAKDINIKRKTVQ